MLCDPKYRDQMTARGDDPERLGELYGDLINTAMSDIPADMTITMHLCRGNYKSTFMGAGGYEAVQEILFNKINVHGYFMEYDDERSGSFEPLRMLPKGESSCSASSPPIREAREQGCAQTPDRRSGEIYALDQLCLSANAASRRPRKAIR